jgi:beta-1,4-mannooligosaccharide/beta-1,4-mannosyl-N-acetylglucosamine phosphorylase
MARVKIFGETLEGIPWQERPSGCGDVVWRYDANPVVPRDAVAGADRVFNSAVVPFGGGFTGVFRADRRNGYPDLYLGRSKDCFDWQIDAQAIRFVDEAGAPKPPIRYGYDPRVVKIEEVFYITWCNFAHGPTIGVARTWDFETFVQLENAFLPFNRNGVLFPRKIDGRYAMLNRPSDNGHTPFGDIFVSYSPDMEFWGRHRLVLEAPHYWWKNTKIGAGPIPIETSEGWLMLYHGVCQTCSGFVYSMGGALLDLDDPSKVIVDCENHLLTPQVPYETQGFVPNVVFPCASLQDPSSGRIAIFYGAADTSCALAFARVDELVDYIQQHPGD